MKVCFLIRSLNIGGAERQLLVLLKNIDTKRIQPVVISFYSEGTLVSEFKKIGIPFRSLEKKGRWDVIPFFLRLIKTLKDENPDIVFSYLVAANLLAILTRPFVRQKGTIISIRHTYLRKEDYDWLAAFLYWIEDRISRFSNLVIINSFAGAIKAKQRGIPESKIIVINNGIDTDKFIPDNSRRNHKRKELGYSVEDVVWGLIGRLDPVKDHPSFIRAAQVLNGKFPNAKFLIIGDGPKEYSEQVNKLIYELHLEDSVRMLPADLDPVPLYNALDVCVSSSIGEGFSNVIAEAMSCEIPCVVTDVGDSARIVGETGKTVPPAKLDALTIAMNEMMCLGPKERRRLGVQARQRIVNQFSIEAMVEMTTREIEKLG